MDVRFDFAVQLRKNMLKLICIFTFGYPGKGIVMKVTVLFGSPHGDGFTAIMLEEYLKTLPDDCRIDVINTYELNASPCFACGACAENDVCINSDLDDVFCSICESDMLIVAAPVYFLSFPAPLKMIIDRMQRFHEAHKRGDNRMDQHSRECVVLLSAGAPSEKGTVIMQQLRWIADCVGISDTKLYVCPDTDRMTKAEFRQKFLEKISE